VNHISFNVNGRKQLKINDNCAELKRKNLKISREIHNRLLNAHEIGPST